MAGETWFKVITTEYSCDICEFEVVKVSEQTITYINPVNRATFRNRKFTDDHRWFPTRKNAAKYAKRYMEDRVKDHQRQVEKFNRMIVRLERSMNNEVPDLFLHYRFTDRGGKLVYDVHNADDHLTMKNVLGQVRLDPQDIDPNQHGTG